MPTIVRRQIIAQANFSAGIPEVLHQVYASRGINSDEALDYQLRNLLPIDGLMGIDDAVERLMAAAHMDERVLIVGDFDADGATSCTVAMRGLASMGFKNIDFLVPNRFEYGYGLTPEIVDVAAERQAELIITVDNGIAAVAGVAHANGLGIDVLVTDHHLPGDETPEAIAIVNPNQRGCSFASKSLAGVGVVFYLLLALRRAMASEGWFEERKITVPKLAELLDIVALGTVADVVPLDFNNRILVEQGLRRIRNGRACAGILALLECAGRDHKQTSSSDLGFVVGPRLNAAGRMEDMSIGIRCLLADNSTDAASLAQELDSLNKERRHVEQGMQAEAERMMAVVAMSAADSAEDGSQTQGPMSYCLYDESWHQGVIGILASRIKDRHNRPAFAFAKASDGTLKGSARSIKGLHIRDVIDEVSRSDTQLIRQFGGHAMAAGLSLEESNFQQFAEVLEEVVSRHLADTDLQASIASDGELHAEQFSIENATHLRFAGPWGQSNPEPLFDQEFLLLQQRLVGGKHLKMLVAPKSAPERMIDAIAFNIDLDQWPNNAVKECRLAYKLDVNYFRGQQNVQLLVEALV